MEFLMNIDNAKAFGEAVKKRRKQLGSTQSQLAAIANTGARFIGDLEKGKPTIQLDKALRVAKLIGLKIEMPDTEEDSK
jgi:y4mF family transcriptional regulator